MLTFAYATHRAWRALEDGAPLPPVDRVETSIVVWRRGLVVCHREIDAGEALALRRVLRGRPFADVCTAFAASSLERAAALAFEAVLRWTADGMLASTDAEWSG